MTTTPPQPPPGYPAGGPQQYPQYGPPAQQYPPQQFQGYGPQQGYAPQQAYQYQPGVLHCRLCGGFPAVDSTVRGHQGLIVVMRFLTMRGPFCKACGIATVRDMTSKSMVQGWWGIGSMLVNPVMMLLNIAAWSKLKDLPEPSPGHSRPLHPGQPLFQRPQVAGLLIPIAVFALIVISNLTR